MFIQYDKLIADWLIFPGRLGHFSWCLYYILVALALIPRDLRTIDENCYDSERL
jgi:hypothetical protein